jgi:hypothetical protein
MAARAMRKPWAGFSNGNTRLRQDPRVGIQRLAQQLGVDLRELVGVPQQYQQYAQQYGGDPVAVQQEQAVEQHLVHFAQSHPHYEQVRVAMGLLLQTRGEQFMSHDGGIDLEKIYHEACKNLGVGSDNRSRRVANISPRSRAPAMPRDLAISAGDSHVRRSIISAINQSRG